MKVAVVVEIRVEVGGGVLPIIGRIPTMEIGAQVETEVVMRTLVSHYYHHRNNRINNDVMLYV